MHALPLHGHEPCLVGVDPVLQRGNFNVSHDLVMESGFRP
jgi:hypothetical protein